MKPAHELLKNFRASKRYGMYLPSITLFMNFPICILYWKFTEISKYNLAGYATSLHGLVKKGEQQQTNK
jgi:hypothetical protein